MKEVVMVIKKSCLDEALKELLDVVVEHKILIRIVEDEDFDFFVKEEK